MSSAKYNKPFGKSDSWTVPLCPQHHRLGPDAQHTMREEVFWSNHGIEVLDICQRLWAARDNLEKMQEICAQARD